MSGYTFNERMGHLNPERLEPFFEAGGQSWMTRGVKRGEEPAIALLADQFVEEFGENAARVPDGVLVEDYDGNRWIT